MGVERCGHACGFSGGWFITNAEDERFMMSSAGQDKLVKSIFAGFKRYKERVEAKAVIPQKQFGR